MSSATLTWASGPVLHARPEGPFRLREAVLAGPRGLPGEVIRLARDSITVQVYEDTSGLRPGDRVEGSGRLLSVGLGPGLLGQVFDGLLRPLGDPRDPWLGPGSPVAATRCFHFSPAVTAGARLAPGAVFGTAGPQDPGPGDRPHGPGRPQRCLVPPDLPPGTVEDIAAPGPYREDEPILHLRCADGTLHPLAMLQHWPVRRPRPVAERLAPDTPMLTGQRLIDCLFPIARGGAGAIPGGFGTGKTMLLTTIAKWCVADVIVYVGCGERGNELAGMLTEFADLDDPRTGRPLAERTVVIANTSNMPVAAREASIYTGITVAEYFRDQGQDVTLMADSTSRWAEALREVSGRLGELPGEAGYPAYLGSRLAAFYERAAPVRTLCGAPGSVTVLGAVSPASGDFSEPVTTHTRRYVGCLWTLDSRRAQARFYPAIHPLQSYSAAAEALAPWWHGQGVSRWEELRRRFLTLLEEAARLERMARIIGRESLTAGQRHTLICAQLIDQGFLRQSAFSANDRYASPARQAAMMQAIARFIEGSERLLAAGIAPEALAAEPIFRALMRMGEDLPETDPDGFRRLEEDLAATLRRLTTAAERSATDTTGVGQTPAATP